MSEGIALPRLARETLLEPNDRIARLDEAMPQIEAVLEGEVDAIAIQATLACLLYETLIQTNFCGFYRLVDPKTLLVGPYQGSMGCLRIDVSRGVCGACVRSNATQRIADVERIADHIACDSRSRSELVIPMRSEGRVRGVLDLDSPHVDGFSAGEAERLEALVANAFDRPGLTWG